MSIAGKPIAGCSPIAAAQCRYTGPFVIEFWGPTAQVFTPTSVGEYQILFWQNPSQVFVPVLAGNDLAPGECLAAMPFDDLVYAYPLPDSAEVPARNPCPRAA